MPPFSRRVFIQRLTFFGGGVVLLGGCRREESTPHGPAGAGDPRGTRGLTERQDATVRAAVDRVLPRDEDPGALDADVPEYVRRQLLTKEMEPLRASFLSGLDMLERRTRARFRISFADAKPEQQDAVLTDFKDSPSDSADARFYELLVVLTLEGFLGDPSYGGNKDYVGWRLVGFHSPGGHPHHGKGH